MLHKPVRGRIRKRRTIRPQSAMLTLYGDYMLDRPGEVGIGSLITLFGNFGLSQPAVRSAVSRMCRAGLLRVHSRGRKSFYSLTPSGRSLLTKGAQRIFVRRETKWEGKWSIVTYSIPERQRKTRDLLRRELLWLGYGALGSSTLISPYDLTAEVMDLATRLGVTEQIRIFEAKQAASCAHDVVDAVADARKTVSDCWDLGSIHGKYAAFLAQYRPRLREWRQRLTSGDPAEPSEYFAERFALIHEYRKLPFYDPDLPSELLPEGWLRPEAAELFQEFHDLLTERANEYLDSVLEEYRTGTRRTRSAKDRRLAPAVPGGKR